jgi:hypothetical protein
MQVCRTEPTSQTTRPEITLIHVDPNMKPAGERRKRVDHAAPAVKCR